MLSFVGSLRLLAIAASVSGCALNGSFGEVAPDRFREDLIRVNEAYAAANNGQILLNIVRASERMPRYFTSASGLSSTYIHKGEASIGLTLPFGGGSTDEFSSSPKGGMSVTAQPSANIAILNTEEFAKAFLSPMSLQDLRRFISEGWPQDVLLLLTVKQITFPSLSSVKPTSAQTACWSDAEQAGLKTPVTLINKASFGGARFACWAREVEQQKALAIATGTRPAGLELQVSRKSIEKNPAVITAAIARGYKVTATSVSGPITISRPAGKAPTRIVLHQSETDRALTRKPPGDTSRIHIQMRSIEGIFYYLGEIVRFQRNGGLLLTALHGDAKGETFATMMKVESSEPLNPKVSVTSGDQAYYLSEASADSRSLTTLNFLSQLISLNQTQDELVGSDITNIFAN